MPTIWLGTENGVNEEYKSVLSENVNLDYIIADAAAKELDIVKRLKGLIHDGVEGYLIVIDVFSDINLKELGVAVSRSNYQLLPKGNTPDTKNLPIVSAKQGLLSLLKQLGQQNLLCLVRRVDYGWANGSRTAELVSKGLDVTQELDAEFHLTRNNGKIVVSLTKPRWFSGLVWNEDSYDFETVQFVPTQFYLPEGKLLFSVVKKYMADKKPRNTSYDIMDIERSEVMELALTHSVVTGKVDLADREEAEREERKINKAKRVFTQQVIEAYPASASWKAEGWNTALNNSGVEFNADKPEDSAKELIEWLNENG